MAARAVAVRSGTEAKSRAVFMALTILGGVGLEDMDFVLDAFILGEVWDFQSSIDENMSEIRTLKMED